MAPSVKEWKLDKSLKCYVTKRPLAPIDAICNGERMAHVDFNGVTWRGSTIENWHGLEFSHFGKALEWVQQSERRGLIEWNGNHQIILNGVYRWGLNHSVETVKYSIMYCPKTLCYWHFRFKTDNGLAQSVADGAYNEHWVDMHNEPPKPVVLQG